MWESLVSQFERRTEDPFRQVAWVRNGPSLGAAMAAAALVACAEGNPSFAKRRAIAEILERVDPRQANDGPAASNIFNSFTNGIRNRPKQGQAAALRAVSLVADDAEGAQIHPFQFAQAPAEGLILFDEFVLGFARICPRGVTEPRHSHAPPMGRLGDRQRRARLAQGAEDTFEFRAALEPDAVLAERFAVPGAPAQCLFRRLFRRVCAGRKRRKHPARRGGAGRRLDAVPCRTIQYNYARSHPMPAPDPARVIQFSNKTRNMPSRKNNQRANKPVDGAKLLEIQVGMAYTSEGNLCSGCRAGPDQWKYP